MSDESTNDPRATLRGALDQAGMVIARITPDQVSRATPCASWDVSALANHVINGLVRFRAAATGETVDWSAPMPEVDGDWATVFRERADALAAAWATVPDITATTSTPMGELSMSFIVTQQIAELAQHTWDLAAAMGDRGMLDDDIAAEALAWASHALKPEFRGPEESGKAFGDQRTAAENAPTPDRLAAFFGRDPAFVGPPV